jgi:hypothetical protein
MNLLLSLLTLVIVFLPQIRLSLLSTKFIALFLYISLILSENLKVDCAGPFYFIVLISFGSNNMMRKTYGGGCMML